MKVGILPIGRPTFDVAFAHEKLEAMLAVLDGSGHETVGPRELLLDAESAYAAIEELAGAPLDRLAVLQVTFTDSAVTVAAANRIGTSMSIWAIPEPRTGGRLRLNSFCGLNLASHALGLAGRRFSWAYADPASMAGDQLTSLIEGEPAPRPSAISSKPFASQVGEALAERVAGKRIARIGEPPGGFDTCAYSPEKIQNLAGVSVDELALDGLFDAARGMPAADSTATRNETKQMLDGLDDVDQGQLDRSLRLKLALDKLRADGGYSAFAIRCWPETFTEYGGAVCGPVSMLGEAGTPCACEADVYGALTQVVLQEVAGAPPFLADVVDLDAEDDTGVVWHCGQAPPSMRDPDVRARATIHSNRKMPLLFEFPLKPGRITAMRISQAFGEPRMVLAGGQMLARPLAFSGTSGVVRFDSPAAEVRRRLIDGGMEHHIALVYGEHRDDLRAVAAHLDLPLMELSA